MLMMSCQKTSQLLSASMDHDITRFQRLSLRLHLLGCRSCARLQAQLLVLKEAGLQLRAQLRQDKSSLLNSLSPELRESLQSVWLKQIR